MSGRGYCRGGPPSARGGQRGGRGGPRGGFRGGPRGRGRGAGPPRPPMQEFSAPSAQDLQLIAKNAIRPQRPGFGVNGRPIKVWANFYPLNFDETLTVYHYDVDISPAVKAGPARALFRSWVQGAVNSRDQQLASIAQMAVFDGGKNIFTPEPLGIDKNQQTFTVVGEDEKTGKEEQFTLKIKHVATIDMHALAYYLGNQLSRTAAADAVDYPRHCVMVLEVLLRHIPSQNFFTSGKGGGSFFTNMFEATLADNLKIHFGWRQALRPCSGAVYEDENSGELFTYRQLLLNVDIATTGLYDSGFFTHKLSLPGPLQNVIANFYNVKKIEDARPALANYRELSRLKRYLKDLSFEITYRQSGRKRYKVVSVTDRSAEETIIRDLNVSVADYFRDNFGIQLRYPWLPCVTCGKNAMIPAELCNVRPNQRFAGRLSPAQKMEMVKVTAIPPHQRFDRIHDGVQQLHDVTDAEFLKSWGVELVPEMVQVDARVLDPPTLSFNVNSKGGEDFKVRDGTWEYKEGRYFANPMRISSWSVAVFCKLDQATVASFFVGLVSKLQELGMTVEKPESPADLIVMHRDGSPEIDTLARANERAKALFGSDADMVFCVIIGDSDDTYGNIKKAAETELGIMTQCMQMKHFRSDAAKRRQYYTNIALKINTKLGGINSYLKVASELPKISEARVPTMIMGFDVTHPASSTDGPVPRVSVPAIVGAVGSIDQRFCQYHTTIRAQFTKGDIIEDMNGMTKELFNAFRARHNIYPKRVIVYRDGVSEGQFGEVVYQEVIQMKKAFRELCGDNDIPTMTYVVVTKRHHARFTPAGEQDGDRSGNVLAGTVIDNYVTHPYEFDFFLNSHPGLQGTSRSAHYHVLMDEHNFTPDRLQEFSYRLCYLFCRATRALSIVPPIYYADLAAYRALHFLEKKSETKVEFAQVLDNITNTMFYV